MRKSPAGCGARLALAALRLKWRSWADLALSGIDEAHHRMRTAVAQFWRPLLGLCALAATAGSLMLSALPSIGHSAEVYALLSKSGKPAYIMLVGPVEQGDTERLIAKIVKVLDLGHDIEGLHLYSPGGNAIEGVRLARTIREFSLTTFAPQGKEGAFRCHIPSISSPSQVASIRENCLCASACAIAWLGGIERRGVPGFHRAYNPDPMTKYSDVRRGIQQVMAEFGALLNEIQTPSWLRDIIMATEGSGIYYLDNRDQKELAWDPTFRDHAEIVCDAAQGIDRRFYACLDDLQLRVVREAYATLRSASQQPARRPAQ